MKRINLNQKGVAMVVVLMVLIGLSLLASALLIITTTDIYVSRNDAYAKEAFFAAEAGLHHAERVLTTITNISTIESMYTDYTDCPQFAGQPLGYKFQTNSGHLAETLDGNRRYEVYVENDEIDLVNGGLSKNEQNNSFIIRSVGYSSMGTRAIVEASYYVESSGFRYAGQMGGSPGGQPQTR